MSENATPGADNPISLPFNIDGPTYADRVGGKLTFRDWDTWKPEDQKKYRDRRSEYHRLNFGKLD